MIDDTLETAPPPGSAGGSGSGQATSPRRLSWRQRFRKPAVLDIRFGPLLSIYAWRLRHHGLQELLAGIGIAIGVALVFGVLVSSQSITGSSGRILHAIVGKATLQVSARSPDGFDEALVERIGQLPGVKVAAPILRVNAVTEGPRGRHQVQLVGATVSQLNLEGGATRYLGSERLGSAVALTSSLASEIGSQANGTVTLLARGRTERLPVHAVWGAQQVGSLAHSGIAIGALSTVQGALSLPRRVTQVYIEPEPGHEAQVRGELERLAAGRVDVQSAEHELDVLDATAQPTTESARLFSAVGGIVGFLFALNAMLLTVPERRRWVAEARMQGYSANQVIVILGFQALVLGVIASAVGVVIGYLISETLFNALPAVLTLSFPIGNQPTIAASAIALAAGAGILAALVASAAPLRDLSPRRPIDAVLHSTGKVGHSIGSRTALASLAAGTVAILAGGLLAFSAPGLGVASAILLALGTLCVIPALLVAVIAGLMPAAERMRRSMLPIALAEAQGTATRSIALASVAGLAIYGSVAVLGTREDLIRGLDAGTVQFFGTANVWVTPVGNNPVLTDTFPSTDAQAATTKAPGIASVRVYQGSFLDVGARRLWIRARPVGDRQLIQASQLIRGNLAHATAAIRAGGWAAVSKGFASEHHLGLGSAFALPSPAGAMPLRVAALTTNSGWPPGAITINQRDYERFWQTSDAGALEVNLKPGVSPTAGRMAVRTALASWPALHVQTSAERERQNDADARQGVQSLSEISRLVLIAAALAIAFALTAAIAAHRVDIASRKADGYQPGQLWRVLLLESALVAGVGVLAGAILGVYGHAVASRWLRLSQGFPAPFSVDIGQLLVTLAIVAGVTLAVVAIAGSLVVGSPPRLGEQE
jgi:putative ABC transport system permease protein